MEKENKRIIITLIGFCILFIVLIVYLSYFQIFQASSVKNNPYNKRLWANEEKVLRGSIEDRNGVVLAYNEKTGEENKRYYNYGSLYSHIIGYSYKEYGKSGLELTYNNTLLDINESDAINDIKNIVLPTSIGNNLRLTIDHSTQEKSRELLANSGYKGSVITMNPRTGEIYSLVSMPDFDNSNLRDNWQHISEDPDSPFLNRATQGLYTPGSIFKIITTAGLIDSNVDQSFECTGTTKVNGYEFQDYGKIAHGSVDLNQAFINSCNTYYVENSLKLGSERLLEKTDAFLLGKDIKFDLPVEKSLVGISKKVEDTKLAATGIGQGDLLVTPLNMIMVTSAIANEGSMVQPMLVKEILNKDGKIIKTLESEELAKPINSFQAQEIRNMMRDVVLYGTGQNANINGLNISGKTGTAENSSGKSHSWFVGFIDEEETNLAVVVLLEESDLTGGQGATPIARDILIHAYNNINFKE